MINKTLNIHDNLVEDEFLFNLNQNMDNGKWSFDCSGGISKKYPKGYDYRFWKIALFEKNEFDINYVSTEHILLVNQLFGFLEFYTKNFIPNLELLPLTIHCNGQTIGQNGGVHLDNLHETLPNYTLMIMINNKWEKEWGGQFEITETQDSNSKIVKSIDYVPGRVIFFDGLLPHRGMAPLVPNILRKTIAYKLVQVSNKMVTK